MTEPGPQAALRDMAALADAALGELRALVAGQPRRGHLVDFHSRHKFLILAHSEACYRRLGPLVASPPSVPLDHILAEYGETLRAAFAAEPTRGTHLNVLQHLAGMCRSHVTAEERSRLTEVIDGFAAGRVSLDAARQLVGELAAANGQGYVARQSYLGPRAESAGS